MSLIKSALAGSSLASRSSASLRSSNSSGVWQPAATRGSSSSISAAWTCAAPGRQAEQFLKHRRQELVSSRHVATLDRIQDHRHIRHATRAYPFLQAAVQKNTADETR